MAGKGSAYTINFWREGGQRLNAVIDRSEINKNEIIKELRFTIPLYGLLSGVTDGRKLDQHNKAIKSYFFAQ